MAAPVRDDDRLINVLQPETDVPQGVDFDTTVTTMALTAKEMNSKYKETSEGGLAVSLVLC